MKIAVGADHRGFELKKKLIAGLKRLGYSVLDCGTLNEEPCDYPDIAFAVGDAVRDGRADRGILLCMSGIGMAIAANKVKGVRAALCFDRESAELSRKHNDANVLVIGAGFLKDDPVELAQLWLQTPFEGGRHERRVKKINDIENHTPPSSGA